MTSVLIDTLYACQLQWLPVGLSLCFIAVLRKNYKPIIAALLIYSIANIDTFLLFLPKISLFHSLHWNWQGKILEFLLALLIAYGLKGLTPSQVGFRWPKNNWVFLYVMILGIIFIAFIIKFASGHVKASPVQQSLETLLFQATMPGLAEEALYRGVYLAILNLYLGRQWSVYKIKYGLGVFVVTLLFMMVHLVHYNPVLKQLVYEFEMLNIIYLFIIGLTLALIREQSASIWPAVMFHNICNLGVYLF